MNEHKERGTITKILSKEFEKWSFGLDYLKSLIYILIAIVIFISIVDHIKFHTDNSVIDISPRIGYMISGLSEFPFEKEGVEQIYLSSKYSYVVKKKYLIGRNRELIFSDRKIMIYDVLIASNIHSIDMESTRNIYVKTQEEKSYLLKILSLKNYMDRRKIGEIKIINDEKNMKIKEFIRFLNL